MSWDEVIPYACMAYRSLPHSTTGCSPNLLILRKETNLSFDMMFTPPILKRTWQSEGIDSLCEYISDMHTQMMSWQSEGIDSLFVHVLSCICLLSDTLLSLRSEMIETT